jgi:hypothetical protein
MVASGRKPGSREKKGPGESPGKEGTHTRDKKTTGVKRDSSGRIVKGSASPNPCGRPRGVSNRKGKLSEALEDIEKGLGDKLLRQYVKVAQEDATTLRHLIERIYPSLKAIEVEGAGNLPFVLQILPPADDD